jgi:WD40 repeat protein
MAAGSLGGTVVLWDPRTGRKVGSFANRGQISEVSFSRDGRLLAVGSGDGTVTIWDVHAGRPARVLHGPTRGVFSVAFSPAGDWLAAGSLDRTVTLWDARTWKTVRVLAHPDVVGLVTFSADGRMLATASDALRLWDTCPGCRDPGALRAEARRTVTRGLTPEERKTFLSGY